MVANFTTHVAYRCPECGTLVFGIVGKFALSANLLRIKCPCNHSSLDISITGDNKIRLSVPCLFCKKNHSYVVSNTIFFERDLFLLNCPYSNMDICFIGSKEKLDEETERATKELESMLRNLEAESLSDIQPEPLEEEGPPDPAAYDIIRFIVKDIESEGKIDCPCHSGEYDLRVTPEGVEVFCTKCNAKRVFKATSPIATEDYLTLDSIYLNP